MIKKSFTYKDLDDNEVTEEFYFALNAAELAELEMGEKGGMIKWLQQIMADEDGKAIMAKFKEIILMSVGQRSVDARRFIKNEQIRQDFLNSEPYSMLFMELVTDAKKGAEFITGLVPKDFQEKLTNAEVANALGIQESGVRPMEDKELPAWIRENRAPTERELVGMSTAELQEAFRRREQSSQSLPGV